MCTLPESKIWQVSELSQASRVLLEQTFGVVTVTGEVSGFTKARSGHWYFNLKDTDVEATKHSKERQFRHDEKISNNAIIQAVEMAIGKIIQDFANGELGNDEPFHIRMVGKGKVPALNVIAVLDMRKGPDTIKVITVMRKDDFKTDTFGGGEQKTYTVQTRWKLQKNTWEVW